MSTSFHLILVSFLTVLSIDFYYAEKMDIHETGMQSELEKTLKMLKDMEIRLKSLMRSAVKYSLPYVIRIAESNNVSSKCIKSGLQFTRDLMQLKKWTLQMLDSFGKPSAGFLTGMLWIQGDYDECINIENTDNEIPTNHVKDIVKGKYCAIMMTMPSFKQEIIEVISEKYNNTVIQLLGKIMQPLRLSQLLEILKYFKEGRLRFDVCIPSACNEDDLETITKQLFQDQISAKVDFCKTKEMRINYTTAQIICIISLSFFFILVTFATILHTMLKLRIIFNCEDNEIIFKNIISISAFSSGELFVCC